MVVVLFAGGCVLLGTGISDIRHAGQISGSGVPVTATVVQDQGWGRYAVRVSYATAAGQQEQGTLDTPRDAAGYPVGSPLRVVYDPASPSVVTLPGSGASAGWAQAGGGSLHPAPAGRRSRLGLEAQPGPGRAAGSGRLNPRFVPGGERPRLAAPARSLRAAGCARAAPRAVPVPD